MLKPYFELGSVSIFHGNCQSILPAFPDGHFSNIVTDPPLSMADAWIHEREALIFMELFGLMRLLKVRTGEAVFLTNPMHGTVRLRRDNSLTVWFTPMLSLKPEPCGVHPHSRPLDAMTKIVKQLDGNVLDPFCGSGSTLVAAKRTGKPAVGIELEEKYCELTAQRLMKETN